MSIMNEIKLLSSQNDLVLSQTEAAFNNIHDMKKQKASFSLDLKAQSIKPTQSIRSKSIINLEN